MFKDITLDKLHDIMKIQKRLNEISTELINRENSWWGFI